MLPPSTFWGLHGEPVGLSLLLVFHPTRQADGTCAKLVAPTAPAGTNLAAQFSITWEDIPPSKIGELQAAAFKAVILKQLPAGGLGREGRGGGRSLKNGMAWAACGHQRSLPASRSTPCRCWGVLHHNDH